jgi:ParB/RepB/Spo0J family partition protein
VLVRRKGAKFELIDGHRRVLAAKLAGLETVPAIVVEGDLSDSEVVHRQLVIDAQRVALNPIERARAMRRLMQTAGWPAATVALKLGVSPGNVAKLLALLELPEETQRDVAAGKLAMSAGYQLARVKDESVRGELAKDAANGKLTRDGLGRKLRRIERGRGNGAPRAASRVTAALGSGRAVVVSGRGLSLDTMVEWLEQLITKARKARAQGIELATFVKMLKDQSKGAKGETPC